MNFDNSLNIAITDISYGQGYPPKFPIVDFRRMKNYPLAGVIQKASQGNYEDPSFKYNWVACRPVLPRSSYHYFDNGYHPRIQAETYWKIIEDDPAGMMWLDLEDRDPGTYYHWDYWYQCLEWLKILRGDPSAIGVYIGHYYFREMARDKRMTVEEQKYFAQYKRWYPWYVNDPFHPDFSKIPSTLYWQDEDVLAVQTGTPAIGLDAGAHSGDLDYNLVNGADSFNKIFMTQFTQSALNISIRRTP